jgi:hypothetical protein
MKRRGEQRIEWNLATAVAALGRSHPALHERAADLDVGDRRVKCQMPPLECNGLADANAPWQPGTRRTDAITQRPRQASRPAWSSCQSMASVLAVYGALRPHCAEAARSRLGAVDVSVRALCGEGSAIASWLSSQTSPRTSSGRAVANARHHPVRTLVRTHANARNQKPGASRQNPLVCRTIAQCRRRDSNPRHADYDSAALTN